MPFTYVFEVDLTVNKVRDLDSLLGIDASLWKPLGGRLRILTNFWPYSYRRAPTLSKQLKCRPIQSRVLAWDGKQGMLVMSLDQFRTTDEGKVYPNVILKKGEQFWVEWNSV